MSTTASHTDHNNELVEQPKEKKLGICCACPDTKRLRDECVIRNGQDRCSEHI